MIRSMLTALIILAVLAGCSGGAGSQAGIRVENAWARVVPMGAMPGEGQMGGQTGGETATQPVQLGNGAAFMVLVNGGSQDDRLMRVETSVASAVELHISEIQNDVMTMRPVEAIDVPAGGQTELKPGGLHIMLIGLKQALNTGDTIPLTLYFEKSGPIEVKADVKTP